jgi:hypothetical protein
LAKEGVKPENTERLTPAQQKQIDQAEARRKGTPTPDKADATTAAEQPQDG